MIGTSCVLLCLAGVLSLQDSFSYLPWDPYRRSSPQCEMCYNSNCYITNEARCEYYAETNKIIHDDENEEDDETKQETGDKIDAMVFELVDTATSSPMFKVCVPFVSQFTDCTEENICLGCEFCVCNEEGKWICKKKQQCRPEPELNIDQQKIDLVIKNLNRKEKAQKNRVKRSLLDTDTGDKDKVTYKDVSKWFYGAEPLNLTENTTEATTLANDVDVLEFNDILQILQSDTKKSAKLITDDFQYLNRRHYESDYDPIRLVKRETSALQSNETQPIVQFNSHNNNLSHDYSQIINDAIYGLNKITNEKQVELEELLTIKNNLVKIAKAHNVSININSTESHGTYTKHHIAIYKLDTFEKCMMKLKHHLYLAIEEIIKNELLRNSTNPKKDLKILLGTIKKYIFHEGHNYTDSNIGNSIENNQNTLRNLESDNGYHSVNPIALLSSILKEVNKSNVTSSKNNPLDTLTSRVKKVLKRVIKLLYLEDFIIDVIVHDTYYQFDTYMDNIGTKWNKMIQDISNGEAYDKLYKMKLLHLTLNVDIAKIEDTITLLEFAQNRRMTIANGIAIEDSVLKIQNNLKAIDVKVQEIIKIQKAKRSNNNSEKKKPSRKISIMQKLKKMFQNSKDDIKSMLRKKFPKSEIIRRITKKKVDELEKQRMLEYQETVNKWQHNLNKNSERGKRSVWGFQTLVDRMKSIIPGYLKGKVKKGMDSKANSSKTRTPQTYGGRMKKSTMATTMKSSLTTIELSTT